MVMLLVFGEIKQNGWINQGTLKNKTVLKLK
jgi:hypothetical protein